MCISHVAIDIAFVDAREASSMFLEENIKHCSWKITKKTFKAGLGRGGGGGGGWGGGGGGGGGKAEGGALLTCRKHDALLPTVAVDHFLLMECFIIL